MIAAADTHRDACLLRERAPFEGRSEANGTQLGASDIDARELRLFQSLDVDGSGQVSVGSLLDSLAAGGLSEGDQRLCGTMGSLRGRARHERLWFPEFGEVIRPNILLIERALQGSLVVPDFSRFCSEVSRIYEAAKSVTSGAVADYIPPLARVNPDHFGVAVCSTDGQRFALGDSQHDFCVQSCCKPVIYCLALEEHGEEHVHGFVGREPSGQVFNELSLSAGGKPHNPMINAGAIMCSSLIRPGADNSDRFEYVLNRWAASCGGERPRFNNPVYQSERQTADRNFALGYYMKEHQAFPPDTDLHHTLDFYFQCCSIEANVEMMSTLAATLANGGVCPTTGERVFSTTHVQHCLSLMCSCGMYDFSGEFAFTIGLPAKSGVGGAILVVIPNVMGICLWSARLDSHGNSVRGIAFCKELVRTFNVHNFDNLTLESTKIDLRLDRIRRTAEKVGEMIWSASKGDLGAIHRLVVRGQDLNEADYDLRTPIHLAAAEGREQVVRYFIENGAAVNPRDRWGGTPLDDARRHGKEKVAAVLEENGGVSGNAEGETVSTIADRPTVSRDDASPVVELIYAASEGNLAAIRRLVARGVTLGGADYDQRTPLHLAAAEGHAHVVQYFVDQGVELSPRDRWGNTPLDDARRHGQATIVDLLASSEPVA